MPAISPRVYRVDMRGCAPDVLMRLAAAANAHERVVRVLRTKGTQNLAPQSVFLTDSRLPLPIRRLVKIQGASR